MREEEDRQAEEMAKIHRVFEVVDSEITAGVIAATMIL